MAVVALCARVYLYTIVTFFSNLLECDTRACTHTTSSVLRVSRAVTRSPRGHARRRGAWTRAVFLVTLRVCERVHLYLYISVFFSETS